MAGEFASQEEERVAISLDKFRLAYDYQVPFRGGSALRGGQVIDFVVYAPFAIPLFVNGEYWHKGQMSPDESLKQELVRQAYSGRLVVLWGDQLHTQDETDAAVRREFL